MLTKAQGESNTLIEDMGKQLDYANAEIKTWETRLLNRNKDYWTLYFSNQRLQERGFFARLFNR